MSLNELAVDLTCHPESFQPAQTQGLDIDEEDDIREHHTPGNHTPRMFGESEQEGNQSPYHVHSGMLRMAKAMGEIGKPVQLAVQEALYHNPEFGKNFISFCGFGQTLLTIRQIWYFAGIALGLVLPLFWEWCAQSLVRQGFTDTP